MKGFAIFLVVLEHAIILFPVDLHKIPWCNTLVALLSYINVPLFFLVSGFCYSCNIKYKSFISKKVFRLVIPYIIFNFADMLPRIFLPNLVRRPKNILEILNSAFFSGGAYWFLYTLFIIFILYPLIEKTIIKKKWSSILFVFILLFFSLNPIKISIFRIEDVIFHLLYFTTGNLYKKIVKNKKKTLKVKEIIVFFTINKVYLLECVLWCLTMVVSLQFQVRILELLSNFIGFIVLWNTAHRLSGLIKNCFMMLGKYSLQIYLLNGFALVVSRTLIVSVCGITSPLFIILGNTLSNLIATVFVTKYVFEPFKLLRIMTGMEWKK